MQSVSQSVSQSVRQAGRQSVSQSVNRSVDHLGNYSVNRAVNQSISQLASSVGQCFCFDIRHSQQSISPIHFLFLKLPPPPCAVLLVFIDQSVTTHSFICSSQDELTSLIRHESDVWRGFIQRHADMVSKAGTYEDPWSVHLKRSKMRHPSTLTIYSVIFKFDDVMVAELWVFHILFHKSGT